MLFNPLGPQNQTLATHSFRLGWKTWCSFQLLIWWGLRFKRQVTTSDLLNFTWAISGWVLLPHGIGHIRNSNKQETFWCSRALLIKKPEYWDIQLRFRHHVQGVCASWWKSRHSCQRKRGLFLIVRCRKPPRQHYLSWTFMDIKSHARSRILLEACSDLNTIT